MENIVRIQQKSKRYRSLIASSLPTKIRTETNLLNDMERHQEINNHLIIVLDGLLVEFPNQKFNISRVIQTLKGSHHQ